MPSAIQQSSYWVCQLCKCTFSGWCDAEELLDHLVEEHSEEDFFCGTYLDGPFSLPMVDNYFKRQIVAYPVKK